MECEWARNVPNTSELALLTILVEGPQHGYQLEQVIEGRGLREWTEIGFSSIYYLLGQDAEGGLGDKRDAAGGRAPGAAGVQF